MLFLLGGFLTKRGRLPNQKRKASRGDTAMSPTSWPFVFSGHLAKKVSREVAESAGVPCSMPWRRQWELLLYGGRKRGMEPRRPLVLRLPLLV